LKHLKANGQNLFVYVWLIYRVININENTGRRLTINCTGRSRAKKQNSLFLAASKNSIKMQITSFAPNVQMRVWQSGRFAANGFLITALHRERFCMLRNTHNR
jgi:hypothetical protein